MSAAVASGMIEPTICPAAGDLALRQSPVIGTSRLEVRGRSSELGTRDLAEESPVALMFNGTSYAVMMASPCDLEDFAMGFALTEGIVDGLDSILDLEIVAHEEGFEARMWVSDEAASRLASRRRRLLGPVGCGLCGLESIEEATRPAVSVPEFHHRVSHDAIANALRALEGGQALNRRTRSLHAAGLWRNGEFVVREDVGRHNALDKLAGTLMRAPVRLGGAIVLVTSRASVDLVQKATRLGASILVAVSAPTALAVRSATASGLTLIGVARGDGFEVYSRPDRIG